MKLLMQFALLSAVYFLGECLRALLPLPVPGTVYGLVLMFALLQSGVLRLAWVEQAADFMLSILPLLFLPGAVGLMNATGHLASAGIAIFLIALSTTASTMLITGHAAQQTGRALEKRRQKASGKGERA